MISGYRIIILVTLILFFSCKKENRWDCFKGNGKESQETRYPGAFDEVEVNDKMDVVIVYGTGHSVEISAGEHILSNISTEIKGHTLKLDNKNTCNFVRGYKRKITVRVTMPYVRRVVNNGVGPITIQDLNQDTLRVRAENSGDTYVYGHFNEVQTSSHGNGDIYLNGSTNSLMVYSYGTNYTHGEGMRVKGYIFISTYSIGDAMLNLEGNTWLDYEIWGKGNIYYAGTASLIRNLRPDPSQGSLIKE